jgi:hypothetical protein
MVGSGPPAVVAASLAALAKRSRTRSATQRSFAGLRERLRDFDVDADGSSFWNAVFERLSE